MGSKEEKDMTDLMQRLANIQEQMRQAGLQAERAGNTYSAHMQLFNVAVSAKDEKGMEEHRLALHTMLDSILDSGVAIANLNEQSFLLQQEHLRNQ
jgi:translation initiation factor IF-2